MSNVEEDRFEAYLKTFQPLQTEPLPQVERAGIKAAFPLLWAAALCGLLLLAGIHDWKVTNGGAAPGITLAPQATLPSPLTLSGINRLLTKADSLKAGLDEVTWKNRKVQIRPGQQSALAVLGKEKL